MALPELREEVTFTVKQTGTVKPVSPAVPNEDDEDEEDDVVTEFPTPEESRGEGDQLAFDLRIPSLGSVTPDNLWSDRFLLKVSA